jgi:hypothetical protein
LGVGIGSLQPAQISSQQTLAPSTRFTDAVTQERLHAHVQQPVMVDAASLVCRVDRHHVTGQGRLHRDLGGLEVADLTDHDGVGVLPPGYERSAAAKVNPMSSRT